MAPIHNRMTTFLEPRYYTDYLQITDRPPLHLLPILPSENMNASLIKKPPFANQQVSLFDSH
jgi:hypothetical protein